MLAYAYRKSETLLPEKYRDDRLEGDSNIPPLPRLDFIIARTSLMLRVAAYMLGTGVALSSVVVADLVAGLESVDNLGAIDSGAGVAGRSLANGAGSGRVVGEALGPGVPGTVDALPDELDE